MRMVRISEYSGAVFERILGETNGNGLDGRNRWTDVCSGAALRSNAGIEISIATHNRTTLK